jgi:hypothetical protein
LKSILLETFSKFVEAEVRTPHDYLSLFLLFLISFFLLYTNT